MTELASFALSNSLRVTVESPAGSGVAPASLRPRIVRAEQTLQEALEPVTAAAAEVIEKFRELPGQPHEIEIQFGVKLDATLGAVIATAAVGTHLDITLRWDRRALAGDPPPPGTG
jgi:NTP-dependent ternary system trypsin peptidase co-occuring protein